jgi:hypothetical protein
LASATASSDAAGMMRRMEDRIRNLCTEVLREEDAEQCRQLIAQLRAELHTYIARLRNRAAGYPVMNERRRNDDVDVNISKVQFWA